MEPMCAGACRFAATRTVGGGSGEIQMPPMEPDEALNISI